MKHTPAWAFLRCLLLLWGLLALFRVAFFIWQREAFAAFSWDTLQQAWSIGLRFDGRIAAWLSLPLLALLFWPAALTPARRGFAWLKPLAVNLYTLVFFGLLLSYTADFGHYSYLGGRLNSAAVDLLRDFKDAARMVWETYPIIPGVAALLLATWLLRRLFRLCLGNFTHATGPAWRKIFSFVACLLVLTVMVFGQISTNMFPLRWSQAYFSGYPEVTALALNPLENIYDTMPTRGTAQCDMGTVTEAYPLVREFLGMAPATLAPGEKPDLRRVVPARPAVGPDSARSNSVRPNVVLIIVESLSQHRTSFFSPELDSTPFTKELAGRSLYFPNYYASARTTAKAIFSLLTGIPDVNQAFATSSRDPGAVDQRLILSDFVGYEKLYCIGGNTNWANIRGVISNNAPGLRIYEEGVWKAKNIDVWGISDLDLLKETHGLLARQTQPFVAIIQTAGFHRPFTVPEGVPGFDYSTPDQAFLERFGFSGPEEYRSLRFTDFSLKTFFELAQSAGYYKNTIFAIVGDHGISETSPAAGREYQRMDLHAYHVPLLIHSPLLPEARVLPTAGGHVDIFPTLAGLAGIAYTNTTLGRDLLDPRLGDDRMAFIQRSNQRPPVLLNGKECFAPEGAMRWDAPPTDQPSWYIRSGSDWAPEQGKSPEETLRMRKELFGLLETARWLLYNNTRKAAQR